MGFLMAGLLQGVGAGVTQLAAQKREDALIALRRQYQQEDQVAEDKRTIAKEERDATLKVGLLSLAQQYKKEDAETEAQYAERLERIKSGLRVGETASKAKIDVAMAVLNSKLDRVEATEAKRLEAQLRSGEVSDIRAADDGSMVVTYKGGRTETRGTKLRDTRSSGGTEGETATERLLRERGDRPQGTLSPKPRTAPAAPAGKTYTQQDLMDTAAARGITPAQAKLLLEEVGYRPAK